MFSSYLCRHGKFGFIFVIKVADLAFANFDIVKNSLHPKIKHKVIF